MNTEVVMSLAKVTCVYIRGPCAKFVDWRQCAAVMQRKMVTLMPSYSGGDNIVVA
jgi:hypothetical protein